MSSTYVDEDRVIKKVARHVFWTAAMDQAPRAFGRPWDEDLIMVLASRFAGDVSCLIGMGVDPARIVAVDVDAAACDAVRKRFPSVRVFHGHAIEAARAHRGKVAIAFLDVCGRLSDDLMETCRKVSMHAFVGRARGVLGVGFSKGLGEKPRITTAIQTYAEYNEAYEALPTSRANRESRPRMSPDSSGREPSEHDRFGAFTMEMTERLKGWDRFPFPRFALNYRAGQTSMLYGWMDVVTPERAPEHVALYGVQGLNGDPSAMGFPVNSMTVRAKRLKLPNGNEANLLDAEFAALARLVGVESAKARLNLDYEPEPLGVLARSIVDEVFWNDVYQGREAWGPYIGQWSVPAVRSRLERFMTPSVQWTEAFYKNLWFEMTRMGGFSEENMKQVAWMARKASEGRKDGEGRERWRLRASKVEALLLRGDARVGPPKHEPFEAMFGFRVPTKSEADLRAIREAEEKRARRAAKRKLN